MIIRNVVGSNYNSLVEYLKSLPLGTILGIRANNEYYVRAVFHTKVGFEHYIGCKFIGAAPRGYFILGGAPVYDDLSTGTFHHDGPGVFLCAYQLLEADWYIASRKLMIQEYLIRGIPINTHVFMGLERHE